MKGEEALPATNPQNGRVQRLLDGIFGLGVGLKINLLLLCIGLLPPLFALIALNRSPHGDFENLLALYIATFVLLFYPLSKAFEELVVLRHTRRINSFVEEVKAGRRAPGFHLPKEKGNEHDFLRLQRNIFWMVQGLKTREAQLQETLRELESAQKQVLESIEYASRIQRSFLPSEDNMRDVLGDFFLLWIPRDGVGGDAYWVKRNGEYSYLAVFDCTGHGVPGAFLTLIVNSLFEQCCDQICCNNPAALLSKMNKGLKYALSQHGKRKLSDDGLEGGVCCIDWRQGVLHFAGARSFLYLAGSDGVRTIKGDRSGVGFVDVPLDQKFVNHSISLSGVEMVYLFTDGITDQIGGEKRLPLGRRRLQDWMSKWSQASLAAQKQELQALFEDYKGGNAQRDDVTVLGFAIKE